MTLVGRMALVALVIGTSVTVSATERVTLSLVLAGWVGWSFVPVLQLLTGLILIHGAAVGRTRALNQYFATHWPWSLWILLVHGTFLLLPAVRRGGLLVTITAAVPMLWTVWLLLEYCRRDLGFHTHRARLRVAAHQAVTYLLVLAYVFFAVALWPRIVGIYA